MALSLNVVESNHEIIVQTEKGEFTIYPANSYKKKDRPDLNHLQVDQKGHVVLDVNYFNPHAMWISFSSNGISVTGSNMENVDTCLGTIGEGPIFDFQI